MVSTRPSPKPAKGRISYPIAATYTPGDAFTSPSYAPEGYDHAGQESTEKDKDKDKDKDLGTTNGNTSHSPQSVTSPLPLSGSVGSAGSPRLPRSPLTSPGLSGGGGSGGSFSVIRATSSRDSQNLHPTSGGQGYSSADESDKDKDKDKVQGLRTWWKGFKEKDKEAIEEEKDGGGGGLSAAELKKFEGKKVFGESLARSIEYASVQVSTVGEDGALYVWGVIPVVVAKCGLYLKDNATEVEGAFRISGSAKRMRELQLLFDTGPRFGKNIVWDSLNYTPHDVATIFRRFLTQAPESIIPTDFYEDFRSVIAEEVPVMTAITRYKALIRSIPPINQYLLLYVLDLLSVFARKSDINLMTAPNLALIFQPGVLAHPVHAMRPREHVLSQQVLEFLIEHQDHFLVGMQLQPRKRSKRGSTRSKASKASKASKTIPQSQASPTTSPRPPSPPPLVKADPDLMPPSESDDEAPAGGYYIIEGQTRGENHAATEAASSKPPPLVTMTSSSTTGSAPVKPRASTKGKGKAKSPVISPISLAPPPPNRARSSSTGNAPSGAGAAAGAANSGASTGGLGLGLHQSASASAHALSPRTPTTASAPIMEELEPSDSDDDAPSKTYEVHVTDAARAREAKEKLSGGGGKTGRRLSLSGGSGGVLSGLGLGRRKTLPTKRND